MDDNDPSSDGDDPSSARDRRAAARTHAPGNHEDVPEAQAAGQASETRVVDAQSRASSEIERLCNDPAVVANFIALMQRLEANPRTLLEANPRTLTFDLSRDAEAAAGRPGLSREPAAAASTPASTSGARERTPDLASEPTTPQSDHGSELDYRQLCIESNQRKIRDQNLILDPSRHAPSYSVTTGACVRSERPDASF